MRGNNKLTLNHHTVIEALQEYFDRRTNAEGRFEVTSISPDNSKSVIVVSIAEPEPVEPEPMEGDGG